MPPPVLYRWGLVIVRFEKCYACWNTMRLPLWMALGVVIEHVRLPIQRDFFPGGVLMRRGPRSVGSHLDDKSLVNQGFEPRTVSLKLTIFTFASAKHFWKPPKKVMPYYYNILTVNKQILQAFSNFIKRKTANKKSYKCRNTSL